MQPVTPQRIVKIETLCISHLLLLRVHTDQGLIGCGESFYAPQAVAAMLHDWMSNRLIGANALDIEKQWRFFYERFINFGGRGAELRALSALDLALWDILGQSCELPIWQLLGGRTRESIPAYCSPGGTSYGVNTEEHGSEFLGWPGHGSLGFEGPLEDNWSVIHRAGDYAEELVKEGFPAMKVWALDRLAHREGGPLHLSWPELRKALQPLFEIRERVGYDIEIMLDGHGFFQWPAALRIAEVMRELKPLWLEDVLRVDNIDTLKEFRAQAGVPIAVTEMFTTREDFRHVLEKRAADYVMVDPTWVGGISETKRIADMTIPYNIPVAMHDCTGPLTLLAGLHVGIANHNVVFQETVRAHLRIVYPKLIDQEISVVQGTIAPPDRVGIGAAWLPELFSGAHPSYRVTT
jgi:galactonate dehydratase